MDVETRRHDAEDERLSAIDVDLLADESGVAAECSLPQLVTEDSHRLAVRKVVLLGEHAATERRDAERLEQRGRQVDGVHTLGDLAFTQVDRARPVRPDLAERLRPLAELEILRRRDPELVEPEPGELARDHHELVGVRVAERLEDDAVDHAEDGAVGADPECQREDRENREPGSPSKTAEGVPKILEQVAHRVPRRGPVTADAWVASDQRTVGQEAEGRWFRSTRLP